MKWSACLALLVPLVACSTEHASAGGERPAAASAGSGVAGTGSGGSGGADEMLTPIGAEIAEDAFTVVLEDAKTVFEPPSAEPLASFPSALSVDVLDGAGRHAKKVLFGISQGADSVSAVEKDTIVATSDEGETFETVASAGKVGLVNAARLRSGRLLSVGFVPAFDGKTDTATLAIDRSDNLGATWTHETATYKGGGIISGLRFHRGLIQFPDEAGTLLVPCYTVHPGDLGRRVELAASSDDGASWSVRGTIAVASAANAYDETAVAVTKDGSLLAVLRTMQPDKAHGNLRVARSVDQGITWSETSELLVSFDGAEPAPRRGVDPTLQLLSNGALVLSSGRPDNWVAVSRDGAGASWDSASITYVNYPTIPASASRFHGSSGYTGLAPLAPHRVLLVGDNCANSWGCPASEGGWTVDGAYRIWERPVNVFPSDVGRIDLAGKYARGLVTIDTDMTGSDPDHPEIGASAVFDGSTELFAGALKPGTEPGSMVVHLDRTYALTRVAIAVHPGYPARARIFASVDGTTWTSLLADTGTGASAVLRAWALPAPVPARHVRVVVDPSASCPETESGCAALNELELSATVDSFENDALGATPRGFTNAMMASVTSDALLESAHALRVHDTSTSAMAQIEHAGTSGPSKTLEFRVRPIALPNAILFGLAGKTAASEDVSAYHLGVLPDGSLERYDAASATWTTFSAAGVVKPDGWSTLRIEATPNGAALYADGAKIADLPPSDGAAAALTGYYFASAGTQPTGDHFLVDDVLFEEP